MYKRSLADFTVATRSLTCRSVQKFRDTYTLGFLLTAEWPGQSSSSTVPRNYAPLQVCLNLTKPNSKPQKDAPNFNIRTMISFVQRGNVFLRGENLIGRCFPHMKWHQNFRVGALRIEVSGQFFPNVPNYVNIKSIKYVLSLQRFRGK